MFGERLSRNFWNVDREETLLYALHGPCTLQVVAIAWTATLDKPGAMFCGATWPACGGPNLYTLATLKILTAGSRIVL